MPIFNLRWRIIFQESLSVREAKELIHRYIPVRKTKPVLDINVHEHSIEVTFDSPEQREQILASS